MTAPAALFDFDGTLLRRDSTVTLMRELLRLRPWRAPLVVPAALRFRTAKSPDRLQHAKNALFGVLLRGLSEPRAILAADRASAIILASRRAGVVRAARAGAERGGRAVVVSAAPGFFLRRAIADLPVEVVATEFELVAGRFTGRLLGDACFGEAKAKAVRQRLGAGAAVEEAWTDSILDAPVMRLARRRCWICPPADAEQVRRIDPGAIIVTQAAADA